MKDILGEPAALPLLQFALLKLWETRDHNRITMESYRRLGGARVALANTADEFYVRLIPEDQVALKRILLRMVQLGEGLEVTSNRLRVEALYHSGENPERINRVLQYLLEARLVRLSGGSAVSEQLLRGERTSLLALAVGCPGGGGSRGLGPQLAPACKLVGGRPSLSNA